MRASKAAFAVAAVLFVAPATARADDPAPTVDQVVAIMAELTDPDIPAANKGNLVIPGFTPDEAGTIDDHLHRMGDLLPLPFTITDVQPAPNNCAGATVQTTGSYHQYTPPGPIVLVHQNGHWLITHDTAMTALDAFWYNANRPRPIHVGQVG
jgi:hypothetical protein